MTDVDPIEEQRLARWLFLSSPLFIFAIVFVQLSVTFLVTRLFAPDLLGEVAARPAAFAALIALVACPMHIALLWAFAGHLLKAVLTGAELPAPPVRTRWRRFAGNLFGVLPDVGAAWIVFEGIADPGVAPLGPLLAVTVLGPIALHWLIKGLGALCRWGWRHWTNRGYQPRHVAPDGRLTAVGGGTGDEGATGSDSGDLGLDLRRPYRSN